MISRARALELAQAEIDSCKSSNDFITDGIDHIYHDILPLSISISNNEDIVREAFADYFMIIETPLYKAMKEEE